jgi:hypothetical protein
MGYSPAGEWLAILMVNVIGTFAFSPDLKDSIT